ncbi:MAG: hypothetical protein GY795_47590 [Desulfobacterales bacterium]|nr:hypothetical protein [Desulfobacterales bacterium]
MKNILIALLVFFSGMVSENIYAFDLEKKLNSIDIHGFISQGFIKSDRNNLYARAEDGTFQFSEFGINFYSELADHLHAGIQFFSMDMGDVGNNEIMVDWVFGDYRWKDWMGFRAGKIKVPYGFYNYTRDADMVRTNIFLPQSVYNVSTRDSVNALRGIGIYGHLFPSVLGSVSYEIQYGEMYIDGDGALARFLENALSQSLQLPELDITEFDIGNTYTGSLIWKTPLEGLRLGGCIMRFDGKADFKTPEGTPLPYDIESSELTTLSIEYTYENLVLAAEYLKAETDTVTRRYIQTGQVPVIIKIPVKASTKGYYFSAAYRFADWFELGTYYSVYYPNKNDKQGENFEARGQPGYKAWLKDIVVSTRFDINEYWIFKLEGHFIDGAATMLSKHNPDGVDKNSFLLAVKVTYNF